ncbi:glycosyltransferase family 2 [Haloferula helveola]|uniref:Glycosyltransferase family 2 n=1 Tax=Haloferula helveola TaxID=490095 RepID=A0ABM7RMD8_9BACT|nr:glycosyltransferase family 2 [Haloferula helveola]
MKSSAITLVHKAAMEIAVPAVHSFARHFADRYRLDIHTDGSPDESDELRLLTAAEGMEARIVRPVDREAILEERLRDYPRTRALLDGVGYNAKLELPMVVEPPYFYFDSDIVWLRPVSNLEPEDAPNAFSTESWTWYNGVAHDGEWIRERVPRRVNSGFHFLGEPFPFERMEDMLERGLFDPTRRYNTDQEIMAFLYPKMVLYHPEDLKRSRRSVRYDIANDAAAALHFPGGMWRDHLDQMSELASQAGRGPVEVRWEKPVPLSRAELWRMRLQVKVSDSPLLGRVIHFLRKLLRDG